MTRLKESGILNVLQNDQQVGILIRESTNAISFQYVKDWLYRDDAFPVSLSLPLREQQFVGESVIAVFDNLLPDNTQIRKRLGDLVGVNGRDSFSLLAALGRDCIGALQFIEGDAPAKNDVEPMDKKPVTDGEIALILKNLRNAPLGITSDREFRISVAGAQEKTALLKIDNQWYLPRGSTPTSHILKPQIGKLPNEIDLSRSVENEHFCMTLLANLGLPVAQTEILDFENERVLAIERFDRVWSSDNKQLYRRPQEDFCQALGFPSGQKYEADGGPGIARILQFLRGSDDPETDTKMFLKAQICFWLLGAIDGHAKNFSVFLASGGRFRLTPLYDVMSAEPNFALNQIPKNQMKMAMCVGDKRRYRMDMITKRHFVQTAESGGMLGNIVDVIIEELSKESEEAITKTFTAMPDRFPVKVTNPLITVFNKRLSELAASKN